MALAHSHNNCCDSTHSHTSSVLCYNHFLHSNAFLLVHYILFKGGPFISSMIHLNTIDEYFDLRLNTTVKLPKLNVQTISFILLRVKCMCKRYHFSPCYFNLGLKLHRELKYV